MESGTTRVMGREVRLAESVVYDGGVEYRLYRETTAGGGSVVVYDTDAKQTYASTRHRYFDQAEGWYKQIKAVMALSEEGHAADREA